MGAKASLEQLRLLAKSVADYCNRSDAIKRTRALRGTLPGFDRSAWREMSELGWLGVLVPEEHGGLGLGVSEYAVVARGSAAWLLPEPLTAATMATCVIVESSNEVLKAELLPSIAAGETIPALAWQERLGVLEVGALTKAVRRGPGKLSLSGHKRFVVGGAGADGYVVVAKGDDGPALYWLPAGAAGIHAQHQQLADGRYALELRFNDVSVSDASCLASGAIATRAVTSAIDTTGVAISAELLGMSARTLEITLEYLRTRSQFGKLIGSYQALQHRAVELDVHRRIGDATLEQVLSIFDSTHDTLQRSAAMSRAKARCCEASRRITREAIQMHGAIGFTDECDVGLYVKRALVLSAWLGNASFHRKRYASLAPLETD